MIGADSKAVTCTEVPEFHDESPTHCLCCHHAAPGGVFTGTIPHRFGVMTRQPMISPYAQEFFPELLQQTQTRYACEEFEIHAAKGRTFFSRLDKGGIDSTVTPGKTHLLFRLSRSLTFWGVKIVDQGLEEDVVRDMASCGRLLAGFIRQKEPEAVLMTPELLAERGQTWQRFAENEMHSQLTCIAREFDFYVSQDKQYRTNVREYLAGNKICGGTFEQLLRQNGLWKNLSPQVENFIRNQVLHIWPWGEYAFDNGRDLGPTKQVSLKGLAVTLREILEKQHGN
jgi:hypothetical protein